jgi:hypothetical protein
MMAPTTAITARRKPANTAAIIIAQQHRVILNFPTLVNYN